MGGCRVRVRLDAWPAGEPKLFQAPVFYVDNPGMPVPGYHASDLNVRDGNGKRLTARDTLLEAMDLNGNFLILPDSARSFSYPVDLAPRDSLRFGLPIPGIAAGVDLIDGAYYFILPLLGRDFAAQWRTPAAFTLEFADRPGRNLVGIDAKRSFASNYELMFVRAAYDPVSSRTITMRDHEVTVYTTSDDAFDLDVFGDLLGHCLGLVEDSLLPLPNKRFFVGENTKFDGIEGVQGYWFSPRVAYLPEVHVHEMVHTFVGVYHSDFDDPWWKEGVTEYLGLLLSLQEGLIGDTVFADNILFPHNGLPALDLYPLSDRRIRSGLFQDLDSAFGDRPDSLGMLELVYGKGAQAAMIIDRYILEGSGGKKSIYDLVRDLVRSYGAAFHRTQLIASMDGLAGGSSAAFLSGLLDQATPLESDSLVRTYIALRKLGRFGPHGGLAGISGVDPETGGAAKPSAEAGQRFPNAGRPRTFRALATGKH